MLNRRTFLKSSPLLAIAPTLPAFLANSARAAEARPDTSILVVVQLDGGNDALNTVVPHADPEYARLRPRLKVVSNDMVKVNDSVGLHPSLRPLGNLLEKGQLAIIPGVSYPNPDRSHFRSMAIWQTAKVDPEDHTGHGWLGRALDPDNGGSVLVGAGAVPVALRGRRSPAISLGQSDDLLLADASLAKQSLGAEPNDNLLAYVRRQAADGYGAAEQIAQIAQLTRGSDAAYPSTGLGERLRLTASLLKLGVGTRIYYTLQSGYDTHAAQAYAHGNLLRAFADAVKAFFADLDQAKLSERVLLLAFSEFGRTIKENASGGTDHGTTGCVFLAGPRVKGGLNGAMPSLTDLEQGEPKMTTDFRRIYATLLDRWLACPSEPVLGAKFEHLPIV
jgi:uncharacterized protein (DUF1501 family)